MHPDADEVLFLISGRVDLILAAGDGETIVEVSLAKRW
jgi:oxalate decarboxylase/phosphoglucose isomerase-like protein (cupin superfamily)